MRVISVNVGQPRDVEWRGRMVRTSIWKSPIEGRVRVAGVNIAGDQQADLRVHGGPTKAVYAYPSEHYEQWRRELPGVNLPWGSFGENLTIEGLLEADALVGDELRIGTAAFVVTEPRLPCLKLAVRFDDEAMIKRFMQSGRTGFYLGIEGDGEIGPGDSIERGERGPGVSIAEVVERTR